MIETDLLHLFAQVPVCLSRRVLIEVPATFAMNRPLVWTLP
jgi:hypothetical protein